MSEERCPSCGLTDNAHCGAWHCRKCGIGPLHGAEVESGHHAQCPTPARSEAAGAEEAPCTCGGIRVGEKWAPHEHVSHCPVYAPASTYTRRDAGGVIFDVRDETIRDLRARLVSAERDARDARQHLAEVTAERDHMKAASDPFIEWAQDRDRFDSGRWAGYSVYTMVMTEFDEMRQQLAAAREDGERLEDLAAAAIYRLSEGAHHWASDQAHGLAPVTTDFGEDIGRLREALGITVTHSAADGYVFTRSARARAEAGSGEAGRDA